MSKRILVVDDSPIMRKMMSKLFNDAGHDVIALAKNGQEAVELYQALQPDIVTMDVVMSDMDGLTAAAAIFNIDATAKILFLSNLNQDKYKAEIEQLGGIGFTNKQKSKDILAIIDKY